ncbi:MAG: hypothetical protein K2X49_13770 [Acetobacteraceae bacterium]|nr:hypothetical protein [Acetobacteraceae bacterium]
MSGMLARGLPIAFVAAGALLNTFSVQGQSLLNPTGDSNYEMDHSSMTGTGRMGAGGGTPGFRITGSGLADAEMARPPGGGSGAGFTQGSRFTGNSGGEGGLEVEHGHAAPQGSFPRARR